MSERKAFLEKISIKNFLSLRDVTLPLKKLTVLVGPNASGKSNVLNVLGLLNAMIVNEKLPSEKLIKEHFWAGGAQNISFQLQTKVVKRQTLYNLEWEAKPDFPFRTEQLSVNDVDVISISEGQRVVRDENGENETNYNSNELALGSAGKYGNKPVTHALTEFIKKWEFYDFFPDFIRTSLKRFSPPEKEIQEFPKLDILGVELPEILWSWHKIRQKVFTVSVMPSPIAHTEK